MTGLLVKFRVLY